MFYTLTRKDINKGHLDPNSFASAVGNPTIIVSEASDFPHYDSLREQGYLTEQQLSERSAAIYDRLQKIGFAEKPHDKQAEIHKISDIGRQLKPWGLFFSHFNDVKEVSLSSLGSKSNPKPHFHGHFKKIGSIGFEAAHIPQSLIWYEIDLVEKRRLVFPGILNEKIDFAIEKYSIEASPFVFLAHNLPASVMWARTTGLSPTEIENIPQDNAADLYADLYHARSFQQISCHPLEGDTQSARNMTVLDYYQHLDCELAARAALRCAAIGRETSAASLDVIYLDMLWEDPDCWFGPTLEALEARKKDVPDFYKNYLAVMEIRYRLSMYDHDNGMHLNREITSLNLQREIGYFARRVEDMDRCVMPDNSIPPQLRVEDMKVFIDHYDELRQNWSASAAEICHGLGVLIKEEVFTDPYAAKLARRILEAGHYFMPSKVCIPG